MLCAAEGLFRARKINRRSTRASQRVMAGKGQQHDIADGSADHVNPGRQVRLRLEGDIDGQYTADVGQQNGPRTRAGYPATTQTLASATLTCYLATSTRSARVASMALQPAWQLNMVIHEVLHMVTTIPATDEDKVTAISEV